MRSNHRYSRNDLILERLDKCRANKSWLEYYPKASVTHLPKTYFDHNPLLISLFQHSRIPNQRIFCHEIYWCHHPNFNSIVLESQNEQTLPNATTCFAEKIKHWATNTFGNFLQRKKELLARLGGIRKSPHYLTSNVLQELEHTLTSDYNNILKIEEDY